MIGKIKKIDTNKIFIKQGKYEFPRNILIQLNWYKHGIQIDFFTHSVPSELKN